MINKKHAVKKKICDSSPVIRTQVGWDRNAHKHITILKFTSENGPRGSDGKWNRKGKVAREMAK